MIEIKAYGVPAAQGSKQAIPYRKGSGGLGVRVREGSRDKVRNWRLSVIEAAKAGAGAALEGPLGVHAVFTMPKPTGLPARRRILGQLVPVVHRPHRKPDLDKLLRSTFDALTEAGIWRDDAQVCSLTAFKTYAGEEIDSMDSPGAMIRVWPLGDAV